MGASQRRKGQAFEQRIARWLREKLKLGDFWSTTDEAQQGNSGDVKDRSSNFPLCIQAKHMKQPSPWSALKEAEAAAKPNEIPVAMIRRHGGEDIVVMRPQAFAAMCMAINESHWTPAQLLGDYLTDTVVKAGW